ncbi:MAG: hypothetical protein JWQ90_3315 [Hydrocarboniphaga sp.]|uniref:hypothetical protein n=1 Tax=Hydrocarboniphaga sp. TaxID=2033016 RepID=UPI002613ABE1|nr:hypothetical protein [Hydrocarboniphaga sp.]MDB5970865.1 hypothetical protein [Hydrocarboniphaga sp.]
MRTSIATAEIPSRTATQLTAGLLSAAAIADGMYLLAGWPLPDIAAFWLLNLYLLTGLLLLPLLLQGRRRAVPRLVAMALCAASLGTRLGSSAAVDASGLPHLLLMMAALLNLRPLSLVPGPLVADRSATVSNIQN